MKIWELNRIKNKFFDRGDVEKVLLGRLLAENNLQKSDIKSIHDVEFKVFSQWGDDGIIQYLTSIIDIPNKIFVEFGVETYHESNTRFLLMKDNWSGLVIDGSEAHINTIRNQDIYWRHGLKALQAFITKENINSLIIGAGITGEIGILSIDIDGNDYWVTEAIDAVNPVILINEYNSVFGYEQPHSVPYDKSFIRSKAHYSNLYYGASITSLVELASKKGYAFIGCNSNGNNAYFIRRNKLGLLKEVDIATGFVDAKFKEGRNKKGQMTFISGMERLKVLKGMPVINTKNGQKETL